jgi:hypothetical protein
MLPPGRYRLTARVGEDGHETAPVVVAAGASSVELRFGALLSIAGFVRFKDGTPVAGVSVTPWPADPVPGRGYRMIESRTGADGSFRFDGLEAVPHNITVGVEKPAGLSLRPARLERIAAGTVDLVIELDRGLTISGRVVAPNGSPLANGEVRCNPMFESDEPMDCVNSEVRNGRFELTGLAAGKQHVVVESPGCASTRLIAEAGARDVVIRLSIGGKVKGRVLLPDGKPAASADVWIEDRDGEGTTSALAFCDADGSFVIEGVGPGVHRVGAQEDSFREEKDARPPHTGEVAGVRVAEGATVENVEIRLAPREAPK